VSQASLESGFNYVVRQRSFWGAIVFWLLLVLSGMHFHYRNEALGGSIYILILLVEMGLVAVLTRKRSMPDVVLRVSNLGGEAGALGAARAASEKVLETLFSESV